VDIIGLIVLGLVVLELVLLDLVVQEFGFLVGLVLEQPNLGLSILRRPFLEQITPRTISPTIFYPRLPI
jgi:hypothetical protein